MMKGKLIEAVRRKMIGGNPTTDSLGKYHPAVIAEEIGYIFDIILLEVYQASKHKKNFKVFDTLVRPYEVEVLCEEDRQEYYSIIPASFVSMPNHVAIRQISNYKDRKDVLSQTSLNSLINIDKCTVGRVSTQKAYYLEGNRVYYYRGAEELKKVLMQIVVGFGEYEMTDEIPVPNSMNGTAFDMIIQRMMPLAQIREDRINDDKYEAQQQ